MTPPCAVESPTRAADFDSMRTLVDPIAMLSDVLPQAGASLTRAAGKSAMSTDGAPGPVIGPAPWAGQV